MNCKQAQETFSLGTVVPQSALDHASECIHCQEFIKMNDYITSEATAWRNQSPPYELQSKVLSALAPKPLSQLRPIFAGGLLATVVALSVFTFSTQSAYAAYDQMTTYAKKVTSAHIKVVDYPSLETYELWWKPGAWREKADRRNGGDRLKLMTPNGIVFHRFDPAKGKVDSMQELGAQPQDFSLEGLSKQYVGPPTNFELKHINPRRDQIIAENSEGWSRMVYQVDSASHLPLSAEKQYRNSTGPWITSAKLELEFNQQFPPQTFDPNDLDQSAGGQPKLR